MTAQIIPFRRRTKAPIDAAQALLTSYFLGFIFCGLVAVMLIDQFSGPKR